MTYLLDVNALVALGFLQHEFHGRVASWVRKLALRGVPELASCATTTRLRPGSHASASVRI
jgi:hypothetical protein